MPGLPSTPRTLTQEQMRATAAPAIRSMQARNEIVPPGVTPRRCEWPQVEASVRRQFEVVISPGQPFFHDGGQHLVILVSGTEAEKPVLKSFLNEWLDPARQSSNLLSNPQAKTFLDSIDPAYAPVVLEGEPSRIRALRAELHEIAQTTNKLVAQMGLIERDDLEQMKFVAASGQYLSWMAEARMAGRRSDSIDRLDALMLRFIGVANTLRSELSARLEFRQQALVSEHAIRGGCTFTVLLDERGANNPVSFSMVLRGLAIHASNPSALIPVPQPAGTLNEGPKAWNAAALVSTMSTEHRVSVELVGLNSRPAAPAMRLSGKLLLVSAYGEQDEALKLARPLADLLRQDRSKDPLTILRAPHSLPLGGRQALEYELSDDLERALEDLTLKSAAALRSLDGFLFSQGMADLIDHSNTGFSVEAARNRINGMGRGSERERGGKLLDDYEYYEHAVAHMNRRLWRGLYTRIANYLDQPMAKQGVTVLPMAAEDMEAILQFLHDDRELVRMLQERTLVVRLYAAGEGTSVQDRVELM